MPANRRVTNIWKLHTCDCRVEFEFLTDANDEPIDASHKVIRVVDTCARHVATPFQVDTHPFTDTAANRPRRDNKVHSDTYAELLTRLTGNATYTGTDEHGNVVLKDSTIAWAFNGAGVLVLTFTPALTTNQRNQLQPAIDTRVGAGLVTVA
jgi:hypothetical protein